MRTVRLYAMRAPWRMQQVHKGLQRVQRPHLCSEVVRRAPDGAIYDWERAAAIAAWMRAGLRGSSSMVMPNGARASQTAFAMAA